MRSAAFRHLPPFLGVMAALTILSPLPVRAQDGMTSREGIALQNQIMDLRQQLSQLQSAPGAGGGMLPPAGPDSVPQNVMPPANGDLTAQLLNRVMTLEQQVRDMRGQLDQLTNQVQQQNAALSKQIEDMNFAAQNGHPAPAGAPPAAAPAAPAPEAPARQTPEALLQQGNAALLHGDYAAAQAAAQKVLAGPRGPRQVDAQFLLAQSLAGQKQYRQSAVAYYDTYNRAPHSGRAPDALLGVTATLLALGDKASACQALAKLKAEFPTPAPRVRSAQAIYRTRAGCH
ncbi:conserved hypothetical protein [Gluconacetobacter diazotrophicus PA1 5]|uniref:Uncharacterized protein n=2 Tax=Gluconacetobacter diazotrophicus TaxID=33996 RepID=A9HB09_GLUDA|nr:tetratricopeptide repeat protein [Gluconacetobacter diazotrophicus]ACI50992.1 conserved hypothetical protein [Gluconacetobacter diazotrophicus PA1 5]MBB2156691.1 hypothetical protein [Gluconacetobacter diazotrophicus]TWB08553.1 TolA-binding protein [Gluconacetobacter diazotrophicus]CAP54751.1 hypothetical protein GDI0808 [Gluconacetobacter diazotrophicus PA1 5]